MTIRIETTATFEDIEARVHHATKAKAVKLADTLAVEYPALSLVIDEQDEVDFSFSVVAHYGTDEAVTVLESGKKVPDLADVQEACEEAGIDPEEGIDEEEADRPSASVVPEAYRTRYREVSKTGTSCGDWLAETLIEWTVVEDKLDVEALTQVFEANGLDMDAPWAKLRFTATRGWQGRFRMNGRQLLEKAIAKTGKIRNADGDEVTPPASFVEAMQGRHAKWLAKERRREAAAEEALREAVEGSEQVEETEGA